LTTTHNPLSGEIDPRHTAAADAAERMESFEALLDGDDVPEEIREAYAGLVERWPGFRTNNADAMTRGATGASPDHQTQLAMQARDWIRSWVERTRPGHRVGKMTLYFEAEESWRGGRFGNRPIPYELFHLVARSILQQDPTDQDRYQVPASGSR
jgi:hypothetical protein